MDFALVKKEVPPISQVWERQNISVKVFAVRISYSYNTVGE